MSAALAAAQRLKAGQPLGLCPQSTILELLQIIELQAAEPALECAQCAEANRTWRGRFRAVRERDAARSVSPHSEAITAREGKPPGVHVMRPEDKKRLEESTGTATTAQGEGAAAGSGSEEKAESAESSEQSDAGDATTSVDPAQTGFAAFSTSADEHAAAAGKAEASES